MAQMDLGYFGDERLKKMALSCWNVFASGRRFVCASLVTTAPRRSNFDDF